MMAGPLIDGVRKHPGVRHLSIASALVFLALVVRFTVGATPPDSHGTTNTTPKTQSTTQDEHPTASGTRRSPSAPSNCSPASPGVSGTSLETSGPTGLPVPTYASSEPKGPLGR